MREFGLNFRASELGVSSVCINIVRREIVTGVARNVRNAGLDGVKTECIDLELCGQANLHIRFKDAGRRDEEMRRAAAREDRKSVV